MKGQALGGDVDPAGKAAGHHPPSDQSLQSTERQEQPAAPDEPLGEPPLGKNRKEARPLQPLVAQEGQERQQEGQPDHPPQQPVRPFPPENPLEGGQGHPAVQLLVLRDPLVFLELVQPGLVRQRRQRPGDRLPFGDREARVGQAGGAAHDDHGEHQNGHREQPDGDGARLVGAARQRHGPG